MDKAEKKEMLNALFGLAHQNLASAEYLSTMHYPSPDETICNLCQQSAEKNLKGYLVQHDILPPKIHDVDALLKMCEKINAHFSVLIVKCALLSHYAVIPRYSFELQITTDDVKTAIQYAKDIENFVIKAIAEEDT